ncbi:transcriptional adapter ADA2-like isoform X1 [Micractinium conductrix]|uniref:Transcriptional adapter n=1 Tax=Micractinium conductrix TaxID=554055 RepID=A0A2P6V4R4_9CHLO|nr:transcriptional adapter ADA2-like isoform X1 [Micractinium conductrix]|eukprot:PSC69078.1 transcriptional adapter ADA2-like isoform X1 [Micractinium conductrix]
MGAPSAAAALSRNKRRRDDAPTPGGAKAGAGKNEGLYHCDYCHKDLSSTLRIKCVVCKDFDLCLECFSVGVQLNVTNHTSDHAYKVVQSLGFPLYHPAWRADEELLLLEGIEIYGLGNWPKVAEHVGKSLEECRGHYLTTYIDHPGFPMPLRDASMAGLDIEQLVDEYRRSGRELVPVAQRLAAASPVHKKAKQGGKADGGGAAAGAAAAVAAGTVKEEVKEEPEAPVAAAGVKTEEGEEEAGGGGGAAGKKHRSTEEAAAAGGAAPTEAHRTQGSFALRPAAPAVDVPVTPGTTGAKTPGGGDASTAKIPAATEAQQTGYNIKRNEFEPEWDFEAETIIAELADFGPDDSPEEAAHKDRLIQIYNRRLDERAQRRQFVLDRGLLNIKRQQAIDKRRSVAERELHGSLRVLARHLPQEQYEALAEGIAQEQRLRARIAELQDYRAMGLRTFEQVDEVEALQEGRRRREAQQAQQQQSIRSRIGKVAVDEGALQEALVQTMGAAHAAATLGQQHSVLPEGRGNGLTLWRNKRGVLLDITALPDVGPLSQRERNLCAAERYLPAQYLAIKAAILKQQELKGRVPRNDILKLPFKVDPARMQRLHDFFVQEGWLPGGAGSGGRDGRQQQQRQSPG